MNATASIKKMNATVSDEATAKAAGDAQAAAIVAKVEKKAEKVAAVAEKNPEDSFPTDWMNTNNVMKYDIDNDPDSSRIASAEADVEAHRKFNLEKVGLVQKSRNFRTANQILYIEDEQ